MKLHHITRKAFSGVLKKPPKAEFVEDCCGLLFPKGQIVFRPLPQTGVVSTLRGDIPLVSPDWTTQDYLGTIGVRLNIHRMNYAIAPGLYAIGQPTPASPVFVTANYKLSFDTLRHALRGVEGWILVLDTSGINVWCAAGKGSFGTSELVGRIASTGLSEIVNHRTLIVPQLGAPGLEAHVVCQRSGFTVVFGPVQARDLPAFLEAGSQATPAMRRITFPLRDRFIISLMEFVLALKAGLVFTLLILAGTLISHFPNPLAALGWFAALGGTLWAAVFTGTVLHAILLPVLPGRAFSVRGGFLGLAVASTISISGNVTGTFPHSLPAFLSLALSFTGVSAYLALNFTGATTFTSHTGVKKEVGWAVPIIQAMFALAVLFLILNVARTGG